MKLTCVWCGCAFNSKRTRKLCGACHLAKARADWKTWIERKNICRQSH